MNSSLRLVRSSKMSLQNKTTFGRLSGGDGTRRSCCWLENFVPQEISPRSFLIKQCELSWYSYIKNISPKCVSENVCGEKGSESVFYFRSTTVSLNVFQEFPEVVTRTGRDLGYKVASTVCKRGAGQRDAALPECIAQLLIKKKEWAATDHAATHRAVR